MRKGFAGALLAAPSSTLPPSSRRSGGTFRCALNVLQTERRYVPLRFERTPDGQKQAACLFSPSFAFFQGGGWGVVHLLLWFFQAGLRRARLKCVRFFRTGIFSTRQNALTAIMKKPPGRMTGRLQYFFGLDPPPLYQRGSQSGSIPAPRPIAIGSPFSIVVRSKPIVFRAGKYTSSLLTST